MSDRYPPIPASEQTIYLNNLFAEYVQKHHGSNSNFKYKDDQGRLTGAFAIVGYAADIGISTMEFGEVILNQKGLSVRERELAILAVTSAYETPFIKYAHSRVALASGLENDQIEQACTGQSPDRITDAEAAVYDLSLELVLTRTVLKEGSWKRYEEVLGKEKCLRVAHVSGLYMYSASFLRLANLQAPA